MSAPGWLLLLLLALIVTDTALWLAYAGSVWGLVISWAAIALCVKVHKWAYE